MSEHKKIQSILGVNVRAHHNKNNDDELYDSFQNPIIHKQINGNVIVPLRKLWDR